MVTKQIVATFGSALVKTSLISTGLSLSPQLILTRLPPSTLPRQRTRVCTSGTVAQLTRVSDILFVNNNFLRLFSQFFFLLVISIFNLML